MSITTSLENDIKIITDYIRHNLSWKEMYFKHFSIQQKVLFFMPIILFLAPIWGTMMLFYRDMLWGFIVGAVCMFLGIFLFFKQKKSLERNVFSKLYASENHTNELDYQVSKIREFMSENNLLEKSGAIAYSLNSNKSSLYPLFIPIVAAIWIPMFMKNSHKLTFYAIYMSILFLFMAVIFVLPTFFAVGSKGTARMILNEIAKRNSETEE